MKVTITSLVSRIAYIFNCIASILSQVLFDLAYFTIETEVVAFGEALQIITRKFTI